MSRSRPLDYRRPRPITTRCFDCTGRFGFAIESGEPVAYHTVPYCPAFDAIETTLDAIRHAERCNLSVKPS